MVDIHQRDIPNENQFDAIRDKAEREQLQPEGKSAQATRDPGSLGGRSGNGQMKPHQSYDDRAAASGADPTTVPEAIDADLQRDHDSQSGGSTIDREVREEERKQKRGGKETSGQSSKQGS